MRADLLKRILDGTEWIEAHTDAWDNLTVEEKLIWGNLHKAVSDGGATNFNAIIDARYGKQPTGGGAELTDGEDSVYEVSFRGMHKDSE